MRDSALAASQSDMASPRPIFSQAVPQSTPFDMWSEQVSRALTQPAHLHLPLLSVGGDLVHPHAGVLRQSCHAPACDCGSFMARPDRCWVQPSPGKEPHPAAASSGGPRTHFTYNGMSIASEPHQEGVWAPVEGGEGQQPEGRRPAPAGSRDLDMRLCSSLGELCTSSRADLELPGTALPVHLLCLPDQVGGAQGLCPDQAVLLRHPPTLHASGGGEPEPAVLGCQGRRSPWGWP